MAQDLDWSLSSKGVVLSIFFASDALTGLLDGYLADRFGGSRVLQTGIILWSVCTFRISAFARGIVDAIVVDRVLLGMGEASLFPPSTLRFLDACLLLRRSRAVSLITVASHLGAVVALALSSLLVEHAS
jgi:ACS family sodium-dependent inorganic phosphate cotransporter